MVRGRGEGGGFTKLWFVLVCCEDARRLTMRVQGKGVVRGLRVRGEGGVRVCEGGGGGALRAGRLLVVVEVGAVHREVLGREEALRVDGGHRS